MGSEHPAGEPRYKIYGASWGAARARVAALSSAHLRPLQLEAENLLRWRQSDDADAARVVAD